MIIDASVWVARFLDQDIHREAASTCLSRLLQSDEPLIVPLLAWAEIAGAIARRSGDATAGYEAVQLLQSLPRLVGIALDVPLAQQAAHLASEQKIRGADAVYVALAVVSKQSLLTLDAEMLERAPASVKRFTPAGWLQRNP